MKYLNYFNRHNDRENFLKNTDLEKSVYIQFCNDEKHIHIHNNQIEQQYIQHNEGTLKQFDILKDLIQNYVDYYNVPDSDINNPNAPYTFNSNISEYSVNLINPVNISLNDNVWNKIICFNNNNLNIYGNSPNKVSLLSLEPSSTITQNNLTANNVSGLNVFNDEYYQEFELESNIVISLFDYKIPMRLMKVLSGFFVSSDIKSLQQYYGPNPILTAEEIDTMIYRECDLYAIYMSMNYTDYNIPNILGNLNNTETVTPIDYPLVFLIAHCNYTYDGVNSNVCVFRSDFTNFRLLMPSNPFVHHSVQYKFADDPSSYNSYNSYNNSYNGS